MIRSEPIDYDAYRRRAAQLRNAAIADFVGACTQWTAARFVRIRDLLAAGLTTHRTPTAAS